MKKEIYLIRHAIAEDREAFEGSDDSLRPLTKKGAAKFEKSILKYKKKKLVIKKCFHSPFLRCVETASIVEKVFKIKSVSAHYLAHGVGPENCLAPILKAPNKSAFIGHEPELSLLCEVLEIKKRPFKKGELRKLKIKIS